MREREPRKEIIGRGQPFYLWHPGADGATSGYGITLEHDGPGILVGLLAVDGPNPVDEMWLHNIEETFGECQLVPMTNSGLRGLACQKEIEPSSVQHLRSFPSLRSAAIQASLGPFLDRPPGTDAATQLGRGKTDLGK